MKKKYETQLKKAIQTKQEIVEFEKIFENVYEILTKKSLCRYLCFDSAFQYQPEDNILILRRYTEEAKEWKEAGCFDAVYMVVLEPQRTIFFRIDNIKGSTERNVWQPGEWFGDFILNVSKDGTIVKTKGGKHGTVSPGK